MTANELHEYLLTFKDSFLDYPFGEDVAVYKIRLGSEEKMFALVAEKSFPIRLSLKCDPHLAKILRERYESVMEGYHLNKKHWNTVLLTGQLNIEEIKDLVVHSYQLVSGEKGTIPDYS